MGPIQLIFVFSAVFIINNFVWNKEKEKGKVLKTVIEIIGAVAIVLILERLFPF